MKCTKALYIAPNSPIGSPICALGAAKKQKGIIDVFCRPTEHCLLINTAHNLETIRLALRCSENRTLYGKKYTECELPLFGKRAFGRCIYIGAAPLLALLAVVKAKIYRQVETIIVYNAGAGEVLMGLTLSCILGGRLIAEIEDMPDARVRKNRSLKTVLDQAALRTAFHFADVVMVINKSVKSRVPVSEKKIACVEGLSTFLDNDEIRKKLLSSKRVPQIGYFGGLTEEKGILLVLQYAKMFPEDKIIVCGDGEFRDTVKAIHDLGYLEFYCNLQDDEVEELMLKCDVLINGHVPLHNMGNGVFPFKIIECISKGMQIVTRYSEEYEAFGDWIISLKNFEPNQIRDAIMEMHSRQRLNLEHLLDDYDKIRRSYSISELAERMRPKNDLHIV